MSRLANILYEWILRIVEPHHLRRTLMITLVVGVWLTAYNQYDALYEVLTQGSITVSLGVQIFLNFLTPFVVSNAGLVSFEDREESSRSNSG